MYRALLAVALTLVAASAAAAPRAASCALAPKEQALATLLVAKPAQLRPVLHCDPELVAIARERAADMAARRYFRHHTPEGVGPNDLLRLHGFALPQSYPSGRANTVEAIVGGFAKAEEVWEQLLGSVLHRAHVLGEDPTYLEQDRFGIGYVRDWNTPQVDFWVVLIARHPVPGEEDLLCSPPPSECVLKSKTRFEVEVLPPTPDKKPITDDFRTMDRKD